MTAVLLLQAICEFLREAVADYAAAQGEKGEYKTPQVFDWYLPFKNPKAPEKIDFPYIVARIVEGEDPAKPINQSVLPSDAHVLIDLAFGVYHESKGKDGFVHPDGAYDLLNLMEHVRIALFKKGILDRKFEIIRPYKWDIPLEQPYPLWTGSSRSIWTVQNVTPLIEGVDIHANKFDWE